MWLGWGHDIFCGVWLFSKTSVMPGYPFPGPLARGSGLCGGGFFCPHHSRCRVAGFLSSKCRVYKEQRKPRELSTFRSLHLQGPSQPASFSPSFRVPYAYIIDNVQCGGLHLVGGIRESISTPIFPKAKQLYSFDELSYLLTVNY